VDSTLGVQTPADMDGRVAAAFPYPCKYLIIATGWLACFAKSVEYLKLQPSMAICILQYSTSRLFCLDFLIKQK
jgi:hypothetical protein